MELLNAPPTGEKLKEIRIAYNLTKREMSNVLGVTTQTLRFYERGQRCVPYKHVKRINRLLSTPVPSVLPSCEELRSMRTSRGLTLKQVAEAFGVALSSISAYEKGLAPIPADLPDCIRGLSEPKDTPVSTEEPSPLTALPNALQQIAQRRKEEREFWLQLGHAITPSELRRLRQARGLSQQKLAERIGILQSSLHCYETGRMRIPEGLPEKIIELFPYRTITPAELRQLRHITKYSQASITEALHLKSNTLKIYEAGRSKNSCEISDKIMEFFQQRAEAILSAEETKK